MGDEAIRSLFSDIWYSYYQRLHVFVRRMVNDPEDVDDSVQEVMLKVFRNLRRYRPDYAVSTWIYTLARNYCLDYLRKVHVRLPLAVGIGEREIESPYPVPEAAALKSESIDFAKGLIDSLSGKDQQIAFLRFFEEMPYSRISSILDIPVGTLKYRVHQIRKILRGKRDEYDT